MKFPRYLKYKPSGVEWIGEIPEAWRVKQLKRCVDIPNGQVNPKESDFAEMMLIGPEHIHSRTGRLLDAESASDQGAISGKYFFRNDDVLFSKIRPALRKVCIPGTRGLCSADVYPLRSKDGTFPKFLFYELLGEAFSQQVVLDSQRVAMPKVNRETLGRIPFLAPPIEEQHSVALFLDAKTAEIDALIAKKERLIELLEEKRSALITRAVTKGLDPSASTRDTGIVGLVPAQWKLSRLSLLTDEARPIMYGIVLPGPHVPGGVPIVKGGDVTPHRLKLELLSRTTVEIESGYVRSRLKGGDLVFAIRGSIGAVQPVPDELLGSNLTQDAARVSIRKGVNADWLLFALRSQLCQSQVQARATGATIRGLNIRDLKRIVLPVPPRPEQDAIALHLTTTTRHLDELAGKVRLAIERLREYRTALISAAVTGKIDVRGFQPTPPCQ